MIDNAIRKSGSFSPAEADSVSAAFKDVVAALRNTRSVIHVREDLVAEIICRLAAGGFPLRARDGGFDRRALTIEATYQVLNSIKSGRITLDYAPERLAG
ncbi:MAG: hypothetical protein OTI36_01805 [Beijerinckiaceae bacterium]|nr:hypothetical protein [Beijerinckiaceae bacterium]